MRRFFLYFLVIVGLLGAAWFALDRWSVAELEEARDNWPVIERSLADLDQVIPPVRATEHTAGIIGEYYQLAKALEKSENDDKRASENDREVEIPSIVKLFLQENLKNPSRQIAPLSPELQLVMSSMEPGLELIRVEIEKDLPVIPFSLEKFPAMPSWQPLARYRNLHGLFVAQALVAETRGRHEKAWSYLFAAARVTDTLLNYPPLIGQIIAHITIEQTALAMRKIHGPAPQWTFEWLEKDRTRSMLLAFSVEAHFISTANEYENLIPMIESLNEISVMLGEEPVKIDTKLRLFSKLFGRQFIRLATAYYTSGWKDLIQMRLDEGLCVEMPSTFINPRANDPRWSWIVELSDEYSLMLADPSEVGLYWIQLHRLQYYLSGSRLILAIRDERSKSPNGEWPDSVMTQEGGCPYFAWKYQREADNSVEFCSVEPPAYDESSLRPDRNHLVYRETGRISD